MSTSTSHLTGPGPDEIPTQVYRAIPPTSPPPVGPPRGKKPFPRRRWVKVTGAITGGSLIAIVAFAAGHGGGTPAAATAPATPATTAPATPTTTAPATPKATTPARPAASPASPAPAKPQTLLQASGSGNYTTARFTVGGSGDYDVYWTYKPNADFASQGMSANFSVQADNGNDMQFNDPNQLGTGGSGVVHVYGDAGTHYLTITGESDWTITVTAMSGQPAAPQGTAQPAQSTQPVQATQGASDKAVVDQFYQDLNARDYQAAWQLGGSNLSGGVGYSAWVAGYATTASINASTVQDNDGTVSVNITATQTDGSVKTYAGTCTVANGVIVSAHITQTS
jgi:hypothetical protein